MLTKNLLIDKKLFKEKSIMPLFLPLTSLPSSKEAPALLCFGFSSEAR